jgi:glycosyltransferase involved in cell wall biosynthesis
VISIIIPTYNQENVLIETLVSVLDQTYADWECIIVDDGSSVITLKIINEFCLKDSRFKFFRRPQNYPKGANACRNYGFEKSVGKYIQWFDADDIMKKDMLKLKEEVLSTSEVNFVVCEGFIFRDHPKNILGTWNKLTSPVPLLDHALGKINFQTNAPMFKRKFLEDKKLWDENLLRKQDYEFFSRLLMVKPSYKILKKPLFYYRIHQESINGRNDLNALPSMIRADLQVFLNIKRTHKFSGEKIFIQRHFLRKILGKLKLGIKHKQQKVILAGISAILQIIDLNYLKNYFLAGK